MEDAQKYGGTNYKAIPYMIANDEDNLRN